MEDDRVRLFTAGSITPTPSRSPWESSPYTGDERRNESIELPELRNYNPRHDDSKKRSSLPQEPPMGVVTANRNLSKNEKLDYQGLLPPYNGKPSPREDHFSWCCDWSSELVACTLVLAIMFAIVGILYPCQDSPLPQLPYNISINSLIAMLIVIIKAGMLFVTAEGLSQLKWAWFKTKHPLSDLSSYDSASRGPWGSTRLLLTLRGRHWVASLGACVTIAALVIDPFAQQVIRYYDCTIISQNANASIPRTNMYDETGLHLGAGLSTIPFGLQSAINGGVFSPGQARIGTFCPTGNCTFTEKYHSVAYCSNCSDATNELSINKYNSTYTQVIGNADGTNSSYQYPIVVTNTSLPGGGPFTISGTAGNDTYFSMTATSYGDATYEAVLGPRQYSARPAGCSNAATNNTWSCRQYGAARCTLTPCMKSYTAKIINGALGEDLVGTVENVFAVASGQAIAALDVDCLTRQQRDELTKLGYTIGDDEKWIAYNISINPYTDELENPLGSYTAADNATASIAPRKCIYQIGSTTSTSIPYFLGTYFAGSIMTDGDEFTGSSVLQTIYNSHNVTFESIQSTFQNISEALTVHMRQNGDSINSLPVQGQILRSETCVHIRWAWLTFPAVLVALTIVFFASLVIGSRHEQTHGQLWKSSPLPLMFHGLHEETLREYDAGGSVKVSNMEKAAKEVHVRLNQTDRGWKLTKTD